MQLVFNSIGGPWSLALTPGEEIDEPILTRMDGDRELTVSLLWIKTPHQVSGSFRSSDFQVGGMVRLSYLNREDCCDEEDSFNAVIQEVVF